MEKESSNINTPDLSRIDNSEEEEEDIYAQLARLDESLNNELEDLKRMVLSQESTSKEGDTTEPDDLNNVKGGDCSNDDKIEIQPQTSQPADQQVVEYNPTDDATGKSKGNRRQRNSSQRGKHNNNIRGSNGKQHSPTVSAKKNNRNDARQYHKESQTKQQVEKNHNAGSSSEANTAKRRAGPSSVANKNADSPSTAKERQDSSSVGNKNADSSYTPHKTQPKRMEGRGRGFRRRQATQRHQEQAKQSNNNNNEAHNKEATMKTTAAEAEGKGRRARARRSRARREQQKVNDESKVAEPRKKKDNLSTEQKQRIIDSLNQGRNNFLSR